MWPERERTPACPSELALTQWQLGELTPEASGGVAAHVETCARCRELVADLTRERERFAQAPLPIGLARGGRARRPGRIATAATAIALVAAMLLWVRFGLDGAPEPVGARTKGDAVVLRVYVEHVGAVVRLVAFWPRTKPP